MSSDEPKHYNQPVVESTGGSNSPGGGPQSIERAPTTFTVVRQSVPVPLAYGRCRSALNIIEKQQATRALDVYRADYTEYWYGQTVTYTSSGTARVHECVQSGTTGSGASAPTGEGTGYVDGSCKWDFKSRQAGDVITFFQHFIGCLCEGEIVAGIRKMWFNKRLAGEGGGWGIGLYRGKDDLSQTLPTGCGYNTNTAYQHTALLYTEALSCNTGSQLEVPDVSVEFDGLRFGDTTSVVNPADIIIDVITHARRGCGMSSSYIHAGCSRSGGDLSSDSYRTYCDAMGFRVSLLLNSQTSALDVIRRLLAATNADGVWSQNKLKIRPLGDVTVTPAIYTNPLGGLDPYVPANTSVRDFGPNDYLDIGEPVRIVRTSQADCFDAVPVEYLDLATDHALLTVETPDQEQVDLNGMKRGPIVATGLGFADGQPATALSLILAQRSTKVRNTFTFRVGWMHIDLEPGDVITLTDTVTGLSYAPARILEIEELKDAITITANDYPLGVSSAATYAPPGNSGYLPNERRTTEQLWALGDGSRTFDLLTDGSTYLKVAGVSASHQVQAASIASNAVKEAKINAGAVTEGKIGAAAVTSGKIGTGAVGATALAANAVTAPAVAAEAIGPVHVAVGDNRRFGSANANFAIRSKG